MSSGRDHVAHDASLDGQTHARAGPAPALAPPVRVAAVPAVGTERLAHELPAAASRRSARFAPAHWDGSGRPLEDATRRRLEGRYGADLSDLRVHTGEAADRSARSYDAAAYTVGSDVFIASGRYAPGTPRGDALLAHEAAHVLQQRGAPRPPYLELLGPEHPSEGEARGERPLTRLPRQALQRQPATAEKEPSAEAPGTGGRLTTYMLLSGQLSSLYLAAFMNGLTGQLVFEELMTKRGSKALEHLAAMQRDPIDSLKLTGGFYWGYVQGLFSPIVDLFKLLKLGVELQDQLNMWMLTTGLGMLDPKRRGAIGTQVADLALKLVILDLEADAALRGALSDPGKALGQLGTLVDQAMIMGLPKAAQAGQQAARDIFEFAELPAFDLGEKLGYVAGAVTIEIALLVATDAIGNAIKAAMKGLEALGTVGRNIVKVLRFMEEVYELFHNAMKAAAKWIAKQFSKLIAAFEEVWKSATRLVRSFAEGIEEMGAGMLAPAAEGGPSMPGMLMSSAEEGAKKGAGKGSKEAVKALYPEKVHPSNLPEPKVKPAKATTGDPALDKEVEDYFAKAEQRGAPPGKEELPDPKLSKVKINFRDVVNDAMKSLKKQGVSGLGPREYGTKLHAEIAAQLERRLGQKPTNWLIGVDEKLGDIITIPSEYSDLTVKQFLKRTGSTDKFTGLEEKVLSTKLKDLKPDLLIAPPGEPIQTWDWVSDFYPSHQAKTNLYSYIVGFTEQGENRWGRFAELYYKTKPKRLLGLGE